MHLQEKLLRGVQVRGIVQNREFPWVHAGSRRIRPEDRLPGRREGKQCAPGRYRTGVRQNESGVVAFRPPKQKPSFQAVHDRELPVAELLLCCNEVLRSAVSLYSRSKVKSSIIAAIMMIKKW